MKHDIKRIIIGSDSANLQDLTEHEMEVLRKRIMAIITAEIGICFVDFLKIEHKNKNNGTC